MGGHGKRTAVSGTGVPVMGSQSKSSSFSISDENEDYMFDQRKGIYGHECCSSDHIVYECVVRGSILFFKTLFAN